MKKFHSDLVQFRGSHYDFGLFQGKLLRDSIMVNNRERQWKLRKPKFHIDIIKAKEAYVAFAPGLWDEINGLSEGLQLPLEQVLRDYGGYRVECPRGGCSTVTNGQYLIRNYDYHPKTYEGRYVLYKPSDTGYATIGPSQRIVGRMDGMNEHGLALAYNFMHRKKPGDGFICNAIGRIILENAKNVSEAVSLLKELPHRHSFSYIVVDKDKNKKIVEATPRKIIVREAYMCTNHFEHQLDENRKFLDDSIDRMNVLEDEWNEHTELDDAFRLLNDTTKGVFVEDYDSWAGTIHTTAYIPKKLEAWISLGGNREPNRFSFKDWLDGQSVSDERIYGEINTNLGFHHIDRNLK